MSAARLIIPKETVIARKKCGGCGKPVQIKQNKNGNAYYFCPWADDQDNPCSHHERYGRSKSRAFSAAYMAGTAPATMAVNQPASPIATKPAANDPRPPSQPAPQPAPPKVAEKAPETPQKQPTGTYEDYL